MLFFDIHKRFLVKLLRFEFEKFESGSGQETVTEEQSLLDNIPSGLRDAINSMTNGELGKLKTDVENSDNNKVELTIDKMKTISPEEFYSLSLDEKLKYITKESVTANDIITKNVKNLEFNFTFDGEYNKDLAFYVTLGSILPAEVRSVTSGGITYTRFGVDGEFYSGNNQRLKLDTGTKVKIGKVESSEKIQNLESGAEEKYNKFIEKEGNEKFRDEEYKALIIESYKKGLEDKELLIVLTSSYGDFKKLKKNRLIRVLDVTKYLDNVGLTGSYLEIGELVSEIEKIVGKDIKGEDFFDEEGKLQIPEGLNKIDPKLNEFIESLNHESADPRLKKFVEIFLSQYGTNERDRGADKYIGGLPSTRVSWCGGYVGWCFKQAGHKGTGSYVARSFIGKSTTGGHVGVKMGNMILGGNQSNKVCFSKISYYPKIRWWIMPRDVGVSEANKVPLGPNKKPNIGLIPDGAIICS